MERDQDSVEIRSGENKEQGREEKSLLRKEVERLLSEEHRRAGLD